MMRYLASQILGPINTPTTNAGAIAGFDPVLKMSKRGQEKRKWNLLLSNLSSAETILPT